jgi:hypothetical protein
VGAERNARGGEPRRAKHRSAWPRRPRPARRELDGHSTPDPARPDDDDGRGRLLPRSSSPLPLSRSAPA